MVAKKWKLHNHSLFLLLPSQKRHMILLYDKIDLQPAPTKCKFAQLLFFTEGMCSAMKNILYKRSRLRFCIKQLTAIKRNLFRLKN